MEWVKLMKNSEDGKETIGMTSTDAGIPRQNAV